MILVVGGIKGGVGKTTLATNLTVLRAKEDENRRVLLLDTDEISQSASHWRAQRYIEGLSANWTSNLLFGQAVVEELPKMANDYDDIIIDVPGLDSVAQRGALMMANVFLMPFRPASFDLWTLGWLSSFVKEVRKVNAKIKILGVINQACHSGNENKEAFGIISEHADITCLEETIGSRKAFQFAALSGMGVSELKNPDKKAVAEIRMLYETIYMQ
jgi:chromosome partitioning protein